MRPKTFPIKRFRFPLNSLLGTSVLIFLILFGTKVLNFFKKMMIGQLFGVSWVADAFFAAGFLPYYLAVFFEGVLLLGFLPLFSQVVSEKGKEEANQFMGEVLLLTLFLTTALAVVLWKIAPWIIGELVPGFSAVEQELTHSLFKILSLVLIFVSLATLFRALNSFFEEYLGAASSALVDTAVMMGLTLLTWRMFGIFAAAWASVIGAVAASAVQGFILFRKHLTFPKRWVFQSLWLRRLFLFLIPLGLIWAFQQFPLVILNRFASGMWEGTLSSLVIAQTLTAVPMGLVSHTVLFAIFPSLMRQANGPNPEGLHKTFFQTLRTSFLILIPVGFFLTAFARPLAVIFFSGGGISTEGTLRIGNSLACFGWATFALYADLFMTQSLIAVRRAAPAIFLSASRAVLTYGAGYGFATWWDYQGLALSFSLALVVNLFLLFPLFFRWSPFREGWGELFGYSAKLILASSPALLIYTFVHRWTISQWMEPSRMILVLGIGGALVLGVVFYLGILFRLRVKEVEVLWKP